jgi:hypothetical protein
MITFLLTISDIITILNGLIPSFGLLIYTFSVAKKDILTFLIVTNLTLFLVYLFSSYESNYHRQYSFRGS